MSFYVFDPEDPLIQAYQRIFPWLFKPEASEMPEMLRSHVRYPEVLFQAQATMYSTLPCHKEQTFYNKEDLWTIAQQSRSQSGQRSTNVIEPFFSLMQFPNEKKAEFAALLPFTPANKNNMIGWMAARSDGAAYGKLRAYQFPKTRFVDGPLSVEARIDQDPQLIFTAHTVESARVDSDSRRPSCDSARRHADVCGADLLAGGKEFDAGIAAGRIDHSGPPRLRPAIFRRAGITAGRSGRFRRRAS